MPYLVGMVALLGLPPFSLFFSEVAIVVAGVQRDLAWVMAIAVALLLVLFAGLSRATMAMLFGAPHPSAADAPTKPMTVPDNGAHGPRLRCCWPWVPPR